MRRAIAHGQAWWNRAFVLAVAAAVVLGLVGVELPPWWLCLVVFTVPIVLGTVRAPRPENPTPIEVEPPVRGRWSALNSPASTVPSHGTRGYGQTYAVGILRPSGLDEPKAFGWGFDSQPPQSYPSFGARSMPWLRARSARGSATTAIGRPGPP